MRGITALFGLLRTIGHTAVAPTAPAEPALSVANDDNGSSVTATIVGTAGVTYQLRYAVGVVGAWTDGLTRAGSGTIVQTGLSEDVSYTFQAVPVLSGVYGLPSNLVTVLTEVSTAPAVSGRELDFANLGASQIAVFGEAVVYTFAGGSVRRVRGMVDRQPAALIPEAPSALRPLAVVYLRHHATLGVLATEVNTGGDVVAFAEHVGGSNKTLTVHRFLRQDNGLIALECR